MSDRQTAVAQPQAAAAGCDAGEVPRLVDFGDLAFQPRRRLHLAGQADRVYPKAALLDVALEACTGIDEAERASAIAAVFGSERWSRQP